MLADDLLIEATGIDGQINAPRAAKQVWASGGLRGAIFAPGSTAGRAADAEKVGIRVLRSFEDAIAWIQEAT